MYVTLGTIAAALDPSGALLPSWRTGWQPCAPYNSPAQNSSSPMYGRSWVGVSSYCLDGAWSGSWQRCVGSSTLALGGVQMMVLNSLGLNGTLPVALRELRTLTTLSVFNNSLVGSIPPEWCVEAGWGAFGIALLTCACATVQGPSAVVEPVHKQHEGLHVADFSGRGPQRADGHAAAGAGEHFDDELDAERLRQQ
jgi:hypothetical protein